MKRKLTLVALIIFLLASCASIASGAEDAREADRIFDADRMMQFDEGTRFEGGIVNGGIINPGLGTYSTYSGVRFEKTMHLGEDAIKVELLGGRTTGYLDFNYYQWDADKKKPSLDASKYHYFKIKYSYDDSSKYSSYMRFWASKDTVLGTTVTPAAKNFTNVNNIDGWSEVVIRIDDLVFGDGTAWFENSIRQFRIYLFEDNQNPDAVCYVSGMGFFETKEDAETYDFASGTYRTVESNSAGDSQDTQNQLFVRNQFAIGILVGCIIGVLISIVIVTVVVNVSLKKRY